MNQQKSYGAYITQFSFCVELRIKSLRTGVHNLRYECQTWSNDKLLLVRTPYEPAEVVKPSHILIRRLEIAKTFLPWHLIPSPLEQSYEP